jgi:hypothetical protein
VDSPPKCGFKSTWFALANEAAHCSFRISRGGVDEDALHWARGVAEIAVKSLAEGGAAVSAIKAKLIYEYVGQCVHEEELWGDVPLGLLAGSARCVVVGDERFDSCEDFRVLGQPLAYFGRVYFKEYAFTVDLDSREPVDGLIQLETLETVTRQVAVGWQDPGEASEGAGFTEFVNEADASEEPGHLLLVV